MVLNRAPHFTPPHFNLLIINGLDVISNPAQYFAHAMPQKAALSIRTQRCFPGGNHCVFLFSCRQSYPDSRLNSPFIKSDKTMHESYTPTKIYQYHIQLNSHTLNSHCRFATHNCLINKLVGCKPLVATFLIMAVL